MKVKIKKELFNEIALNSLYFVGFMDFTIKLFCEIGLKGRDVLMYVEFVYVILLLFWALTTNDRYSNIPRNVSHHTATAWKIIRDTFDIFFFANLFLNKEEFIPNWNLRMIFYGCMAINYALFISFQIYFAIINHRNNRSTP